MLQWLHASRTRSRTVLGTASQVRKGDDALLNSHLYRPVLVLLNPNLIHCRNKKFLHQKSKINQSISPSLPTFPPSPLQRPDMQPPPPPPPPSPPPQPPLSLTPQSLKRKLQEISDYTRPATTSGAAEASSPSLRSPPTQSQLFLPTSPSGSSNCSLQLPRGNSSPFRISRSSSPTRSLRAAKIVHSTVSQNNPDTMTPLQMVELHKAFAKRPAPFPLELLKPTVLSDIFLKGRALERYFQRRMIREDSGLKPLHRPFVRSSPPSVPFSSYLERLFRYGHPEPLHVLAIVAYSERLVKAHGLFVPPTGWHRFTVAAWIVAGKALLGDQYWTNQYWARVAGISAPEICALETELTAILDWHLQIPVDELTAAWYLAQL